NLKNEGSLVIAGGDDFGSKIPSPDSTPSLDKLPGEVSRKVVPLGGEGGLSGVEVKMDNGDTVTYKQDPTAATDGTPRILKDASGNPQVAMDGDKPIGKIAENTKGFTKDSDYSAREIANSNDDDCHYSA